MMSTGTDRKNSTKIPLAQRTGRMSDIRSMARAIPITIESTTATAAACKVAMRPGRR